jgi:hypothetical protein
MRQRKFQRGEPFGDMMDLADWLAEKGWCYWRDRPKHANVIEAMSFATLKVAIRRHPDRAPTLVRAVPYEPPPCPWAGELAKRDEPPAP